MSDQYYTKEELELLNSSEPVPQEPQPIRYTTAAPDGQPQPMDDVPPSMANYTPEQLELIAKMQGRTVIPTSTESTVQKGSAVAGAVFSIIFGLVFMLGPLMMGLTMAMSMKATGDLDGGYWLAPLAMVSIFVLVGATIVVKGIITLVKHIKNK